jgi:hypothetical protein
MTKLRTEILPLLFLLVVVGLPKVAAADDYVLGADTWTGLSAWLKLTATDGVEIEQIHVLDYSSLDVNVPLLILYPKREPDADSIAAFVRAGGSVLIADDFGMSDGVMNRFAIDRALVDDLGGDGPFPVLQTMGQHPLLVDVTKVATNHPARIYNVGRPVVGFPDGAGLVYDMKFGTGKAVFLSDPSIMINHMLGREDNANLMRNTLRYLCPEQPPCKARLAIGRFGSAGSYRGADASALRTFLDRVNEIFANPSFRLADSIWRLLSVVFAITAGVFLMIVLPLRDFIPASHHVATFLEEFPPPLCEFEWNMKRYAAPGSRGNHLLPMALFKEVFEDLFLGRLGVLPAAESDGSEVPRILAAYEREFLEDISKRRRTQARRSLVEVLTIFEMIPSRHRVFLDSDLYVSHRDMERCIAQAEKILYFMGLEEAYQRRLKVGK